MEITLETAKILRPASYLSIILVFLFLLAIQIKTHFLDLLLTVFFLWPVLFFICTLMQLFSRAVWKVLKVILGLFFAVIFFEAD